MSGCTATTTNGMDCLNHADREFINSEGSNMALCDKHDEQFYALAITAAATGSTARQTDRFLDALAEWSRPIR